MSEATLETEIVKAAVEYTNARSWYVLGDKKGAPENLGRFSMASEVLADLVKQYCNLRGIPLE